MTRHQIFARSTAAALAALSALAIQEATALPVAAPMSAQYDPNYRPDHRQSGGYEVNRMGYGNYTRGADGGFGGYPPGSDGAKILQEQQRRKCRAVPETC